MTDSPCAFSTRLAEDGACAVCGHDKGLHWLDTSFPGYRELAAGCRTCMLTGGDPHDWQGIVLERCGQGPDGPAHMIACEDCAIFGAMCWHHPHVPGEPCPVCGYDTDLYMEDSGCQGCGGLGIVPVEGEA